MTNNNPNNNNIKLYNRIKYNSEVTPEHQWQIKDSDNCYISMSTNDLEGLMYAISKELTDEDTSNKGGYQYVIMKYLNARFVTMDSNDGSEDDFNIENWGKLDITQLYKRIDTINKRLDNLENILKESKLISS